MYDGQTHGLLSVIYSLLEPEPAGKRDKLIQKTTSL